jgi:hypothetical protein
VARRASTAVSDEARDRPDAPPIDPTAVDRAYRTHRARRRARLEHRRRHRHAGRRFWVTLLLLVTACAALLVTTWNEIQKLFGL